MGYSVRGDPFIHVIYRRQKSDEIVQKKLWILNTLPNGITHLIMPLSTTKTDKILHNLLPILNTLPNGVRLAREKT